MIDYYDNFLEEHVAQLIDMQIREVSWKYDYDSKPNGTQKHWHVFCGHNINVIPDEYEFIIPIWEKIKNVINVELERVYLNAHTFGIEPHIHTDDGDITMIYYPIMKWKTEWGGGTSVYDNDDETKIPTYVPYVGNRLLTFSASLPHQAMPVARVCYQLRSVIVFKCDVNNI